MWKYIKIICIILFIIYLAVKDEAVQQYLIMGMLVLCILYCVYKVLHFIFEEIERYFMWGKDHTNVVSTFSQKDEQELMDKHKIEISRAKDEAFKNRIPTKDESIILNRTHFMRDFTEDRRFINYHKLLHFMNLDILYIRNKDVDKAIKALKDAGLLCMSLMMVVANIASAIIVKGALVVVIVVCITYTKVIVPSTQATRTAIMSIKSLFF